MHIVINVPNPLSQRAFVHASGKNYGNTGNSREQMVAKILTTREEILKEVENLLKIHVRSIPEK